MVRKKKIQSTEIEKKLDMIIAILLARSHLTQKDVAQVFNVSEKLLRECSQESGTRYRAKIMKTDDRKVNDSNESMNRGLGALIRVIIETIYAKKEEKFTECNAIRILMSAGSKEVKAKT